MTMRGDGRMDAVQRPIEQRNTGKGNLNAMAHFDPPVEPTVEPRGCRCGDVLRGVIAPDQCPLFGRVCTAESPVGPCMVSSEGSCAAYWRYRERSR